MARKQRKQKNSIQTPFCKVVSTSMTPYKDMDSRPSTQKIGKIMDLLIPAQFQASLPWKNWCYNFRWKTSERSSHKLQRKDAKKDTLPSPWLKLWSNWCDNWSIQAEILGLTYCFMWLWLWENDPYCFMGLWLSENWKLKDSYDLYLLGRAVICGSFFFQGRESFHFQRRSLKFKTAGLYMKFR